MTISEKQKSPWTFIQVVQLSKASNALRVGAKSPLGIRGLRSGKDDPSLTFKQCYGNDGDRS